MLARDQQLCFLALYPSGHQVRLISVWPRVHQPIAANYRQVLATVRSERCRQPAWLCSSASEISLHQPNCVVGMPKTVCRSCTFVAGPNKPKRLRTASLRALAAVCKPIANKSTARSNMCSSNISGSGSCGSSSPASNGLPPLPINRC